MTRFEAIEHLKNIAIYSVQDGYTDGARQALDMAIKALEEPERKKGEWITYRYLRENWSECECDQCHKYVKVAYDYCPNCGADMRGENDD